MATLPYATLAQLKRELKDLSVTEGSATAQSVLAKEVQITARIFRLMGWEFIPRIESRDILVVGEYVNSRLNTIEFRDPLLVLQGVTVGNTTLTVGTDVTTYPNNTPYPYHQLRLIWSSVHQGWYNYADCATTGDPLVVTITGIWGYRTRYMLNGWLPYDILQANISASVTTLTIADADGTDPFGFTPRFSPGQLIQIDSEWMQVTATNTTTNVLTVIRGVQGSTPAAHINGAVVSTFQVEDDLLREVTRQACMWYARVGAFEVATINDIGTTQYPSDLLTALENVLYAYDYG